MLQPTCKNASKSMKNLTQMKNIHAAYALTAAAVFKLCKGSKLNGIDIKGN